ncbi:MAG TPA: hypothetical protein VHN20_00905, partial [Beijerinckiaceae bacterium]|nr:hypothetical protein [Beijerinckiaceae bacterium]
TNAATALTGAVAPGEVVTIYGTGIGPAQLVTFELTTDRFAIRNQLAGTRVLFDGFPAPILYTRADQVSAIVPFQVAGRTVTELRVEYQGQTTPRVELPVLPASPGLFTSSYSGSGQGAILNQDYWLNSAAAPAARGSVVMLYGTGAGQFQAPLGAEELARSAAALERPVVVRIGGEEAEVLYAGTAPGLPAGVVQINARVPAGISPGGAVPVWFAVDGRPSRVDVTLAVR